MYNKTCLVANRLGLHARAAAKFVKLAETFDADIFVEKNGIRVSGISILGLMMLAAGPGSALTIEADGPEADRAVESLSDLVENKFDED
ncbi:MAG: HPr family phosphocarrier protein [Rhodospirillaceae bacterium]|nr:HPr family phosphocarrier protein [Alphaproteobacteria bacterium]MBR72013.1 HPr family phosphocarrier protein [Rhodospirillaceae bacterium]